MKPFKTHQEQLSILVSRGLEIKDPLKAQYILEVENYYGVINGYKDFFLKKDSKNQNVSPEKYKEGATFEEIYQLYSLDRSLRNVILEQLLKFESNIKSKVSYRFTEEYSEAHAYLIHSNYTRDPRKLKDVLNLISTISNTISKKGKDSNNPIGHYLDKHSGVPLWVLVHYLSFGNMQYFYACLNDSLKNVIAKDFSSSFYREHNSAIHFTPDVLENILKTFTFFRNVCAHEERLYNFKLRKPARSGQIAGMLNIPHHLLDKGNLFTVVSFLKLVLTREEHNLLVNKIEQLFASHRPYFISVDFSSIQNEMGFMENWTTYFDS